MIKLAALAEVNPLGVVQVKCWDPAARKPLPLYRCYGKGVGHHGKAVKCVAVFVAAGAAGGKISASGGEDNVVRKATPRGGCYCLTLACGLSLFLSFSFFLLQVRCWDPGGLGVPAGGTVVAAPARLPVPEADMSPSTSASAAKKADRAVTPLQKNRKSLDGEAGRKSSVVQGAAKGGAKGDVPAAFTLPPVAKASAAEKRG